MTYSRAVRLHNGMVVWVADNGGYFYFADLGSDHLIQVDAVDNNNPSSLYRRGGPLYQEICRAIRDVCLRHPIVTN